MGKGAVPVGGPRGEQRAPGGEGHGPTISPRENRPHLPPLRASGGPGLWLTVLVALLAGAAVAYFLWYRDDLELTVSRAREQPAPAAAAPPQEPAVKHPLEQAPEPASLPALGESDGAMREALARLFGGGALAALLHPDRVIARIVVTVDNLPRRNVPARMLPVKAAPGAFETTAGTAIDAKNAARYAPYVALAQAADARALVDLYVRFYPLFQKAYGELGDPRGYFNDRVIAAIDDLLAAPEPKGPLALTRPKVLYEYADPALESRSAGQKILLRMGGANAAKVKGKLREIRAELAKRSARQ